MHVSSAGLALVQKWEGCRLRSYKCSAGVWTVGWGATGKDIGPNTVWTQTQADTRLRADIDRFALGVKLALGAALKHTTQAQFDAMTSMAFNVGIGAFKSSTLLKMHVAKDFAGAQAQFQRWNKAGGRVIAGLTSRRADEAKRYGARS